MAIIRGVLTQTGADTFTQAVIDTNLTVDGKSGWQILGFKATWLLGYTVAATDNILSAILSTRVTTVTLPSETEEIARVSWAVANTAGVAVAYPFEPIKSADVLETRITVQPNLYVSASSTTTGLTNVLYYEFTYEPVKLSDLEVMRLLQGGT